MSLLRHDHPRRPKVHYGPVLMAALVLAGLLIVGKLARSRFGWWEEAAFSGQVVAKEARSRAADAAVDDASALKDPAKHRFYLHLKTDHGTSSQEVVSKLYQAARLGDQVDKRAGSYECRCAPAAPGELQVGVAPAKEE